MHGGLPNSHQASGRVSTSALAEPDRHCFTIHEHGVVDISMTKMETSVEETRQKQRLQSVGINGAQSARLRCAGIVGIACSVQRH